MSFYKKVSTTFVYQVLGALIALGAHVYLARTITVDDFGLYNLAISWIGVSIIITNLGLGKAVLRFYPTYEQQLKNPLIKGFFRTTNFIPISISMIILILIIAIHMLNLFNFSNSYLFLIFFAALPFKALININSFWFQAKKLISLSKIPSTLLPHLMIVLFVFIGDQFNFYELNALTIGKGYLIINAILCLITSLIVYKIFIANIKEHPKFQVPTWLRVSIPLALLAELQFLYNNSDVILLGALSSSHSVGLYSAAFKITIIVSFGLQAINFVFSPDISRYYFSNNTQELQNIVHKSAKLITLYAGIATIVVFTFGKAILTLFGPEYTLAYSALLVLSIGMFVNAFCGPVGSLLNFTNHHILSIKITLISLLSNVILNATLIPLYGILGAAIATSISFSLRNIIMVYFVKSKLGIKPTLIY